MTTDQRRRTGPPALGEAFEASRTAYLYELGRRTVRRSWRASAVRRLLFGSAYSASDTLERSWRSASVRRYGFAPVLPRFEGGWRRLHAVTRRSFLHRWFTTEPEPQMIVIDLRETYTVGPVIALADRLAARLEPLARTSRLERVASRFARAADVVAAGSWTVRAITKLLEPPERHDEE